MFSFWFEFQPSREAYWIGAFVGKRVPIRPDILVCKGNFRDAGSLQKVDLIIECKNEDFQIWQTELETQVIPYFERYKPANMILASMKPMPSLSKQMLENVGIKAVDLLNSRKYGSNHRVRRTCSDTAQTG